MSTHSSEGRASNSSGMDWLCSDPDCKNLNFARRTHCNRCQREKTQDGMTKKKLGTEIGKAAAEKSRGLFSAEDWQCSKCANVNWARRQTCNMCNSPKFCDVEERTGYGGGYNDRGVVEYKEREDSDDDYDEFGRRRKRKDETPSSQVREKIRKRSPSPVRKAPVAVAEESDEEDDGDDADLSKYDLWGSDNEATNNDKRSSDGRRDKRSLSKSSSQSSHSRRRGSSTSSSSSSSSTSSSSSSRGRRRSPRSHKRRKSPHSRSRSPPPSKYSSRRR
ncbi:Zinc finger Ran-binding domain-containing protein 2 [Sergentomyia squamirostris]